MKKILLSILLLSVFAVGSGVSDEIINSYKFAPMTPELIGQGGSFTAVAHGYNSLFTNPAGFARKDGSFTLLSLTATPYFKPEKETLSKLQKVNEADGDQAVAEALMDIEALITGNGIGAAAHAGMGLVSHGLGIGLIGNTDFYGRGETALGTSINAVYDWALIGGLAFPMQFGPVEAYIGGDLRYMMRAEALDIDIVDFTKATAGSSGDSSMFPVYYGSGLGFDMGTILELGNWSFGFSARDIGGTILSYKRTETDDMSNIFSFGIEGESVETTHVIPMVTSYGIGYDPERIIFPSWLIDPMFHAEYKTTYSQGKKVEQESIWFGVHIGTEIELLRFITLRAGINQGYETYGVGVKLLFLDMNLSYFTRETGSYIGEKPNEGVSLEAAIRF